MNVTSRSPETSGRCVFARGGERHGLGGLPTWPCLGAVRQARADEGRALGGAEARVGRRCAQGFWTSRLRSEAGPLEIVPKTRVGGAGCGTLVGGPIHKSRFHILERVSSCQRSAGAMAPPDGESGRVSKEPPEPPGTPNSFRGVPRHEVFRGAWSAGDSRTTPFGRPPGMPPGGPSKLNRRSALPGAGGPLTLAPGADSLDRLRRA